MSWCLPTLCVLALIDLSYQSVWINHDFFAKYYDLQSPKQIQLVQALQKKLKLGERFDDQDYYNSSVGLNRGPLAKIAGVSGYSAIVIQNYSDYLEATRQNPKLLNALNVTALVKDEKIQNNPAARLAFFPQEIQPFDNKEQLLTLDPIKTVLVAAEQKCSIGQGEAQLISLEPDHLVFHLGVKKAGLLVIGQAFYPNWRATVNQAELKTFPVDVGLTGLAVPAGEYDLTLDYLSRPHQLGGLISLATIAGLVVFGLTKNRFARVLRKN
jgi:hypothetical protein